MNTSLYSNELVGAMSPAFHAEHTANRLWTMLLRRLVAGGRVRMRATVGNRCTRLV